MVPVKHADGKFLVSEYKNTYKTHTLLKITGLDFASLERNTDLKVEGMYNTRLSSFYIYLKGITFVEINMKKQEF